MTNRTLVKKGRRRRRRTIILAAVGAVVILILLALLIDSTLYRGKVHAGVTVSGVQLGGLTPEEAKAALDLRVEEAQKNRITLTSGDKKWTVAPEDVGTKVDTAATVRTAMDASRKSNFIVDRFRGFAMYFKDKQIPLEGTIDSAKVDQIAADVARSVDLPPINAGLVFDGPKIKIVKGQKGRVVDREALASQLKAVLLTLHATELPVPMAVKDPTVQADDYDQALKQAMTMTGSPIQLTNGDRSWTLDTEEIIAYMDFASKTQDGVSILVPYLSATKMAPFLNDLATAVAAPRPRVGGALASADPDAGPLGSDVVGRCRRSLGRLVPVPRRHAEPQDRGSSEGDLPQAARHRSTSLVISVEAGLGFEQALDRTTRADARPALRRDSAACCTRPASARPGPTRSGRIGRAHRRARGPPRTFILAMLQADTFGVSIARHPALPGRRDAGPAPPAPRRSRRRRHRSRMLFPLVLCIFPATLVVVVMPRPRPGDRQALRRR